VRDLGPSHRAKISAVNAVRVTSSGAKVIGHALDLAQAVYYRRFTTMFVNAFC